MSTVLEILESLEETQGSLAKKAILVANVKNSLLKSVFIAAQDPYRVYFVNKFQMPKPASRDFTPDDEVIGKFLRMLDTLANRECTGNAAKSLVELEFSQMSKLQQKWCHRIILRNLRCGVQESTVNKVWLGAIKKFEVQLANTIKSSYSKETGIKLLEPVKWPVRCEPKLDGLRCIAVKNKGIVTMYTRSGTVIETLPTIKAILEAANYDDFVLDGETISGNNWNDSSSIIMSRKEKKDDTSVVYNVFDAVSLYDWISQDENKEMPYKDRIAVVADLITRLPKDVPVKQVQGEIVDNEGDLLKFYAGVMDKGYEGIMLKDLNAPYKFKRSNALLKLKPVMTHELVIIGHYEGRVGTKNEGGFGGFIALASNGVTTRVGGGFNDAARAAIEIGPDEYIGRIIECECQPDPLTNDGLTKDGRLRFPVFCRYRDHSDVDQSLLDAYDDYCAKNGGC